MKTHRMFLMLVVLAAIMVGTVASADFYVYRNMTGQTLVLDYVPVDGWARVDGPYETPDAAKRAWAIGTTVGTPRRVPLPPKAGF